MRCSDIIATMVDGSFKVTALLGEWIYKLKLGKWLKLYCFIYTIKLTNLLLYACFFLTTAIDNPVDQCTGNSLLVLPYFVICKLFNWMTILCAFFFSTIVTVNDSVAVITLIKKLPVNWNNLDSNAITTLLMPANERSKL